MTSLELTYSSLWKLAGVATDEKATARGGQATPSRQDGGVVEACVICLQPVSERAITVPCNHHIFDFICIASWLNERSTCPLCNEEITEIQYDWRAPHDYKTYKVTSTIERQNRHESEDTSHRGVRRQSDYGRRRRAWPSHSRDRELVRTEEIAVLRRRHVYRRQLYSSHVGSNRVSCYQELTPELFAASSELQSRARRWMRRELQVFRFLQPRGGFATSSSRPRTHATNAEFLLEYIVAILRTVDIKDGNGRAEDLLAEFLGRRDAKLFLHELSAWLRSPYSSLYDWDEHVQYSERLSEDAPGNHRRHGRRLEK